MLIEYVGPNAPLQKGEVRLTSTTLWRIYFASLALTVVASYFDHEAAGDVIAAFANAGWYFTMVLSLPYLLANFVGALASWEGGLLIIAVNLFILWMIHLVVKDIPKSFNRQHSHGNYVHSHQYDDRLTHYHDDRHPDRVYYR